MFLSLLVVLLVFKTANAELSTGPLTTDYQPIVNSQTISLLTKNSQSDNLSTKLTTGAILNDRVLLADSNLSGVGGAEIYTPTSDEISIYVVREGDTLSVVAEMFNVSVNTIKWANDISGSIKEGDILIILPVTGVRHEVKKGETLAGIAKKYNSKTEDVASYNGLDLNMKLILGTTIIVPNGEIEPPKPIIKSKSTGANIAKATTNKSLPTYSGYYMRPIVGGVKTQGIHGNNAVDLAHALGVPMYASASGQIIVAKTGGWNGGYGNYIVIAHSNGTQTLYGHLQSVSVTVGQAVNQGDQIGALGSSGNSTGPHVHFEIRGANNPF